MANVQDIEVESTDQTEEQARAGLYGLLAELFYAPPSISLIERIASSKAQGEGVFDAAWNTLAQACETMTPAAIQEEYEQLFISVGKPEVILYGSYYMTGFMMEKPLAELRSELARLGLERAQAMTESEDHIAALCEVMRYLILERGKDRSAGQNAGESAGQTFAEQKKFFAEFIQPWVFEMCSTLSDYPAAHFYAALAGLAKAFFEIEAQAFEMA